MATLVITQKYVLVLQAIHTWGGVHGERNIIFGDCFFNFGKYNERMMSFIYVPLRNY